MSAAERLSSGCDTGVSKSAARRIRELSQQLPVRLSALGVSSIDEFREQFASETIRAEDAHLVFALLAQMERVSRPVSWDNLSFVREFDLSGSCHNLTPFVDDMFLVVADTEGKQGFVQVLDAKGNERALSRMFTKPAVYGVVGDGKVVIRNELTPNHEFFVLWNPQTGVVEPLYSGQGRDVNAAVQDGRFIVFPAKDDEHKVMYVWSGEPLKQKEYHVPTREVGFTSLGFTADDHLVLEYQKERNLIIEIFDPVSEKTCAFYRPPQNSAGLVRILADETVLVNHDRRRGSRQPLAIWSSQDADPVIPMFPEFLQTFSCITTHRYDPRYILVAGNYENQATIERYDRQTGAFLPPIVTHELPSHTDSRLRGMIATESGHVIVHWDNSVYVYGNPAEEGYE